MSETRQRKRKEMVSIVRRGLSMRTVARRFHFALSTVQLWVRRAGRKRLDRVDFSDRPHDAATFPSKTPAFVETQVLALRKSLQKSALGEYGAASICFALAKDEAVPLPCERSIHRILDRRGALDGKRRTRRPTPRLGWYLPDVAARRQEMD